MVVVAHRSSRRDGSEVGRALEPGGARCRGSEDREEHARENGGERQEERERHRLPALGEGRADARRAERRGPELPAGLDARKRAARGDQARARG